MHVRRETVSVIALGWRIRRGGAGGRLTGTTGQDQGNESDCGKVKGFEFLHATELSSGHATRVYPIKAPSCAAMAFRKRDAAVPLLRQKPIENQQAVSQVGAPFLAARFFELRNVLARRARLAQHSPNK